MNIDLNKVQQKHLEMLAKEEGKPVKELAQELFQKALAEMVERKNGAKELDEKALWKRQKAAMEKHWEELDALPAEGLPEPEGRPVSEYHDEILYGGSMVGQEGGFPERRS